MKRVIVGIGMAIGLGMGCTALTAQTSPATVIIVRHAEKGTEPANNPPLTDAGVARAVAIAAALKDAGVSYVYTNQLARTSQTGKIIADSLHAQFVTVPIVNANQWVGDLVDHVKHDGGGKVSVIVGHSNTFGPISKGFGGVVLPDVADPQYDDLVILTVQNGQPTRVIRAKQLLRSSTASQ